MACELPIMRGRVRTSGAQVSHYLCRNVILGEHRAQDLIAIRSALLGSEYSIVAEVGNTDELLFQCEQKQPDLVIMDATLPGITDALVAIRQLKRRHIGLTILATGAISQNATVMESLTMGASDFILKPLQARAVRACVERNGG